MVLVIVEGTDRSGKTTLTHAIRDVLNRIDPSSTTTLFHAEQPEYHPLDEYEQPLFDYRPGKHQHVICDRWHIGECVYPDVFQRTTELTAATLLHIEAFLQSRGALLVHVMASTDVLRERFNAEEHAHERYAMTWEQLLYSRRLFRRDIALSCLPKIEVDQSDSTANELKECAERIVTRAFIVGADAANLAQLQTYVGPPRPRVLLLGDVRHKYRKMNTDINVMVHATSDLAPSFAPFRTTSGEYLLTAIHETMAHGDIGLINANDVDDPYEAWKILHEPRAIALGVQTWRTVGSWAHSVVPHPQFVHRFHNSHAHWYHNLIERAIREGGNLIHERL